jgi:predicted Zn-dependent peptidase
MDIQKKEMKNGLIVASEVMPQLRSVAIGVWVRCGSRFEDPEVNGISHFIEHLLFKGTKSRRAVEIAKAIDSVGGQLDAFTDKEYVGFYAKVLDEHMEFAFELLSDIVLHPTFPAGEIEHERKVIFEEIAAIEDTPQDLVHELYLENFWKGHPLGRRIAGLRETVAGISRAQVIRYFKRAYHAGCNTVVAVAGHIDHRKVQNLAARYFSALPAGAESNPGPPPVPLAAHVVRRKSNLEQTHLCLGVPCPSRVSEDRFTAHLLSSILGGGLSSRLFQNIREKRGLVYAIDSILNLYRDAGTLMVSAATAHQTAATVGKLILKEFRRLHDELVSEEELKRAQECLKGSLILSLESTSSRMTYLAQQQIDFGRFYTLGEILDQIDRVRRTDIRRLARTIFDAPITWAVLGDGGAGPIESLLGSA